MGKLADSGPAGDGSRGALRAFALDVTTSLWEPWAMLRTAVRTGNRQRWYRRMTALGRPVDHGPQLSLRELGAEPHYQQLFQELDVRRFFTSVRERAFTAVVAELRRTGYDTSEFEQAAQFVFAGTMNLNTGAGIQNVDSPNWGNQAAGQGNTVRQSQLL